MLFKIFILFIGSLLPIVSTECAAANEPINNANYSSNLNFKHKATVDSIASPAPILSTAFFAKPSDKSNLLFFLL